MAANSNSFGPPGVTNDSSQGYAAGSSWTDIATGRTYVCTDPTVGAAVWLQVSTNASTEILQVNPEGLLRVAGGAEIEVLGAILRELKAMRLIQSEAFGIEFDPEEEESG